MGENTILDSILALSRSLGGRADIALAQDVPARDVEALCAEVERCASDENVDEGREARVCERRLDSLGQAFAWTLGWERGVIGCAGGEHGLCGIGGTGALAVGRHFSGKDWVRKGGGRGGDSSDTRFGWWTMWTSEVDN
jgi:hypothetical protein